MRKTCRNVLLDSFHPKLTPEFMVQELLWTLSEKVPPEMVLEGYLPQEWWTAVMESTPLLRSVVVDGHTSSISSLVLTDDGWLPVHLLLKSMWGGSSSKPQMQSQQTASYNGNKDDFMELAAACSALI